MVFCIKNKCFYRDVRIYNDDEWALQWKGSRREFFLAQGVGRRSASSPLRLPHHELPPLLPHRNVPQASSRLQENALLLGKGESKWDHLLPISSNEFKLANSCSKDNYDTVIGRTFKAMNLGIDGPKDFNDLHRQRKIKLMEGQPVLGMLLVGIIRYGMNGVMRLYHLFGVLGRQSVWGSSQKNG